MKNKRINLEERIEIYRLLDKDKNLRKIANFLKRSVSSISEEIKQGKDKYGKYNPVLADRRSIKKAKSRRFGKRKINKKEVAKQTKITKI